MEWTCKKGQIFMNLVEEFVNYLNQPGFERFISAWINKYRSLGHLGGKIVLDHLSELEQESLGIFLGLDLSTGDLSLTYAQFCKILQSTKYEGIDFLKIIQTMQANPIYTKQEVKEMKSKKEECFKNKILENFVGTFAYSWLSVYLNKDKMVHKNIHTLEDEYFQMLIYVGNALNSLPVYHGKYMLLPVFSQQITLDPHYFDKDLARELLLKGITYLLELNIEDRSIESTNELFYQAGLLRDDLSNNCYICHIQPLQYTEGWAGFYENYEPWNMNLYNLMKIDAAFEKSKIYIVENPSVFRVLTQYIQAQQYNVGLICSNGQINLCTYLLLDKLLNSNCEFYYAGDYDPEGLFIADKLKSRYKDHLHLWMYNEVCFKEIMIKQKNISNKRRQLLAHIENMQLKEIADLIIQNEAFGYQEGLIHCYIDYFAANDTTHAL